MAGLGPAIAQLQREVFASGRARPRHGMTPEDHRGPRYRNIQLRPIVA
jgi:hypothetical protein